VRITHDLVTELEGSDVVIVEDIVDTGLTLGFLIEHLRARGAGRVDVCTLLDRPARRILPLTVRYVGAEIPDVFVLGYGQHVADLYRNVPRVVEADRSRLVADPEAYVALLYGSRTGNRTPPGAD
jgi:hypoxanthine phosphoribosyltransferase